MLPARSRAASRLRNRSGLRPKNLFSADKCALDPNIFETAQFAGQRIPIQDHHVCHLVDLKRSVLVLTPSQKMSSLSRHSQSFFAGQTTFSDLSLGTFIPTSQRLPCSPQHRI